MKNLIKKLLRENLFQDISYNTTTKLIEQQKWFLHEGLWEIPYEDMSNVTYININNNINKNYGEFQDDEKIDEIIVKLKSNKPLEPIALSESYTIIDGHHRFEAAKTLKIKKIPVIFIKISN